MDRLRHEIMGTYPPIGGRNDFKQGKKVGKVCDQHKLDERGLRGAPDRVAEVLSPATASHDQTTKLAAYERAGVPEVWLIHPTDRTLTIYRVEAGCYRRAPALELKGQTPITSVSGVTIDWD
jgi:hypothetical protein